VRRAYQQFQEDLIRLAQRCAEVANEEVMRFYEESAARRVATPATRRTCPRRCPRPRSSHADPGGRRRHRAAGRAGEVRLLEGAGVRSRRRASSAARSRAGSSARASLARAHRTPRRASSTRCSGRRATAHDDIQNPIEPGHFLTDTVKAVEALWLKLMNECVADVVRDLDAALGQARPGAPRGSAPTRGSPGGEVLTPVRILPLNRAVWTGMQQCWNWSLGTYRVGDDATSRRCSESSSKAWSLI
jgi:hypothetical protein